MNKETMREKIVYETPESLPVTEKQRLQVAAIKAEDIEYSDIPKLTPEDWARARHPLPRAEALRRHREQLTITLDGDLAQWVRSIGDEQLNERLRELVERER